MQRVGDHGRPPGVFRHITRSWRGPAGRGTAWHGVVVFRAGRRTTDPALITPDALELVTREELMRRNTVHRLPREVAQAVQLVGALRRQINRRTKDATA